MYMSTEKTSAIWRRKTRPGKMVIPSKLFRRLQGAVRLAPLRNILLASRCVAKEGNIMATPIHTSEELKAAGKLSNEEILRYSRHLIMPEVGMEGQLKLKAAKVLLIGTGGLGAPLGLYLAAAGVGKLGLVDFDVVDFTNLQRQVTFG